MIGISESLHKAIRGNDIRLTINNDNVLKTQSSIGPAKRRRRFSSVVDKRPITMTVNKDLLDELRQMYSVELSSGTLPFLMTDQITGDTLVCHFESAISVTTLGSNVFKCTFDLSSRVVNGSASLVKLERNVSNISSEYQFSFNVEQFNNTKLMVYKSGLAVFSPDVDISSSNSLVFQDEVLPSEEILTVEWPFSTVVRVLSIVSTGQSSFSIPDGFNIQSSMVFIDGERAYGASINISDGQNIIFTSGTNTGDVIKLVEIFGASFIETEYVSSGNESVINIGEYDRRTLDVWLGGKLMYGSNIKYISSTEIAVMGEYSPLTNGQIVTINKWSN